MAEEASKEIQDLAREIQDLTIQDLTRQIETLQAPPTPAVREQLTEAQAIASMVKLVEQQEDQMEELKWGNNEWLHLVLQQQDSEGMPMPARLTERRHVIAELAHQQKEFEEALRQQREKFSQHLRSVLDGPGGASSAPVA